MASLPTFQLVLDDSTLLAFDDMEDSDRLFVQSPDLNLWTPLDSIPERERVRLEECRVQLQETGRELLNILSILPETELQSDYEG